MPHVLWEAEVPSVVALLCRPGLPPAQATPWFSLLRGDNGTPLHTSQWEEDAFMGAFFDILLAALFLNLCKVSMGQNRLLLDWCSEEATNEHNAHCIPSCSRRMLYWVPHFSHRARARRMKLTSCTWDAVLGITLKVLWNKNKTLVCWWYKDFPFWGCGILRWSQDNYLWCKHPVESPHLWV